MIVADVNLPAYLLISGEHTERARAVLRKDAVWVFPYLWRSEFRNILAMHMQHRGMSLGDASLVWDHAASLARDHEKGRSQAQDEVAVKPGKKGKVQPAGKASFGGCSRDHGLSFACDSMISSRW